MASHHFIGTGPLSTRLRRATAEPEALLERVTGLVADTGLAVVSTHWAAFDNGGVTLVWILAESHLVVHVWGAEGFATVDLHVCDYCEGNRERAEALAGLLDDLCFTTGEASWRSLELAVPPVAVG